MCRLLCVADKNGINPVPHLNALATISKNSKEYQGHGWGCTWLDQNNSWQIYRNIKPIWEDTNRDFPATRLLLAHARSAFRDEGICVENNMPFIDDNYGFVFNGELQGVRIKQDGRIGAEKIFNYIKRFDHGDGLAAINKAVPIIRKRCRYVRALNFVMADRNNIYWCSEFGEDPDYFQMQTTNIQSTHIICSQAYDHSDANWEALSNQSVGSLSLPTT